VVAARHRSDLRHGLMALVDEQQGVLGQIFEKRGRRLARQAAGQETRIILDSGARARRGDHLKVEIGALLEPLRLEQLALGMKLLEALGELVLDRLHRLLQSRPRRHIMRVRINLDVIERRHLLPRQRIELDDLLDIVAEEIDAPGGVLIMGGENLQIVATDPEIAAREGLVVALVLERHELADDLALIDDIALLQREGHRRISLDRADAVEARDRGDDDHVVPFQERARRRVAHRSIASLVELSFSM
jgi:hypothetical protein